MTGRFHFTHERALWLSRCILPHEPALRSQLARWGLPDDLEADDVVQECYAKLAMLPDVDAIANPRAYFYQVARSIILMHVRRSRVVSIQAVERVDQLKVACDDPTPDTQASDRQQLHLLATMISALPPVGREAATLRFVHELSHREIGERLGMTPNAVQKSLAKSLGMFMRILGRGGTDMSRSSKQGIERDYQPHHDGSRDQLRD